MNKKLDNKKEIILTIISLVFITLFILVTAFIILKQSSINNSTENKEEQQTVTVSNTSNQIEIQDIKLLNKDLLSISLKNNENGLNLYIKNNTEYNISVRAVESNSNGDVDINLIGGYCDKKSESYSKIYMNNLKNEDSYTFTFYIRDKDTNSDIYKTGAIMLKYNNNSLSAYSTSELIPLTLDTLENTTLDTEESMEVNTTEESMEVKKEDYIEINKENEEVIENTEEVTILTPYVDEYKSKIGLSSCGFIYLNKDTTKIADNAWETEDKVKISFMIGYDKTPSITIGNINSILLESGYKEEQITVREIYSHEVLESENGDYIDEMHEITLVNDSLVNIFYAFNYGYKPSDTIVLEIAFPGEYTSEQIAEFIREVLRNYRLN